MPLPKRSYERPTRGDSVLELTRLSIFPKVKAAKGQLRLAEIDPQIYEVFKITKLDKLFSIHETAEAATKSFQ